MVKLVDDTAEQRVEPARLGRREVWRDVEARELLQDGQVSAEPRLELPRGGGEGGGSGRLWVERLSRVVQEGAPIGLIRDGKGADQAPDVCGR